MYDYEQNDCQGECQEMKKILGLLLIIAVLFTCSACISLGALMQMVGSDDSDSPDYNSDDHRTGDDLDINDSDDHRTSDDLDVNDEYEAVEDHCEWLISRGDYLGAYQYIKERAAYDALYNGLLAKYTDNYVEFILKTAQNYADNGNYEQAVKVLKEAKREYNCTEFSTAIDEYSAHLPINILDCHIIDEEDYVGMALAEDCFGNQYDRVFGFKGSFSNNEGGYAVFYLNGKYNNLSGIFVGSTELYEDMEVDCRIYADGELIYESEKLGRTSLPVNINLDVTGVVQLRVEYMWYTWWTTEPCCIFDLTLSQ